MAAATVAGLTLTACGRQASWVRVWSASFAGPAGTGVSQRSWDDVTGKGIFGSGEIETTTDSPANVHVDGHGDLDLIALGQGTTWTSARLQTRRTFAAPPGGELKITAAIRQPDPAGGLGYWPAFWLLGPGTWPEHGEIDVLEDVNGLGQHSAALHCGNLTPRNQDGTFGPCHEETGLSSGLRPCPGCQQGYHIYSVIIDRRVPARQQIRWYLDGKEFFSVSETRVGAAAWRTAVDHGFRIILDLAIGGSYPGTICRCDAPTSSTTSGGVLSIRDLTVDTLTGGA